jgi:RHS repeat-associated protein
LTIFGLILHRLPSNRQWSDRLSSILLIGSSTTPGSSSPYQYDDNGALAGRPDNDGTAADTAKTIEYDRDGRVKKVITGDGHTVESVYDFRGERVVRIVDAGLPTQAVTFFYGKWFEVTGNQLTRNFHLGNRLIAISKMNAPAGLTLASVVDPARRIEVARVYDEALGRGLYPEVHLTGHAAVAVGATLLLLCIGLGVAPGRTRVAVVGRMRRGRVGVVVVIFAITLTPLPLARPAWGGCNNCGTPVPPPPKYPVFFVHGDHLGSTMMLTCRSQPTSVGCADGSVYRYFRYDAYGRMSAYDEARNPVARGNEVAERLYTGQRWDWQAQVYYYGARFYDPRVANFHSRDPAREYMNPYAYVAWKPLVLNDPTGRYSEHTLTYILNAFAAYGAKLGDAGDAAAAAAAIAAGASLAAHYAGGTGGAATTLAASELRDALAATVAAFVGLSNPTVQAQLASAQQGGGVMSRADPQTNASTPYGEAPSIYSVRSWGVAFTAGAAGGFGRSGSAAVDISGVAGRFSGDGENPGYGEAASYGGFIRAGSNVAGIGGDQRESSAYGGSFGAGLGVFVSNAYSQFQFNGEFNTAQLNMRGVSFEFSFGSVWIFSAFLAIPGLSGGGSLVGLHTFTPDGAIHGGYR